MSKTKKMTRVRAEDLTSVEKSTINFDCRSCGEPMPQYGSIPVPSLCPKCQKIEDDGGKATRNGVGGEPCCRCVKTESPFNASGWLCPTCHDEDTDRIVMQTAEVQALKIAIDVLTLRNAELLIEKRDALFKRDDAVKDRENWYNRYRKLKGDEG